MLTSYLGHTRANKGELYGTFVDEDEIGILFEGKSLTSIRAAVFHELLHLDEAVIEHPGVLTKTRWFWSEVIEHGGKHDPWITKVWGQYNEYLSFSARGYSDSQMKSVDVSKPLLSDAPWRGGNGIQ